MTLIVNYILSHSNNKNQIFELYKYFINSENIDVDDIQIISSSITNLERLGMIEISFSSNLPNEQYDFFFTNRHYIDWIEFLESSENEPKFRFVRSNSIWPGQFNEINVQKGIVHLTEFGYAFISACVIEQEVEGA